MRIKLSDLLIFFSAEIAGIVFLCFNSNQFNNIQTIMPIVFGFGYILLLSPAIRLMRSKTAVIFAVCEYLRMVVLVLVTGITQKYGFKGFRTTDSSLLTIASLLIAYEYILGCITIYLYSSKHKQGFMQNHNLLSISLGEKIGIMMIVFSALGVYLTVPMIRGQFNFLILNAGADKVHDVNNSFSSILVLALNYTHYGFLCAYILFLDWTYRRYSARGGYYFYFLALCASLISVGIIYGESRATLIYTGFAIFVCMANLFPEYKRTTENWMLFGLAAVFMGMTVYRLFFAYKYTNYFEAIAAGSRVGDTYYSDFLESYLLGAQSVAAGIQLAKYESTKFTFLHLLYDLFRPFMGFNLLLKNVNLEASTALYNSMLSGVSGKSYGVFLQITAQGYCYFGFFFAPLFLILFLLISFMLEKWITKTQSLFVYFFLSYMFIRIATVVLGGTMSGFITTVSMVMFIMLFFWMVQKVAQVFFEK